MKIFIAILSILIINTYSNDVRPTLPLSNTEFLNDMTDEVDNNRLIDLSHKTPEQEELIQSDVKKEKKASVLKGFGSKIKKVFKFKNNDLHKEFTVEDREDGQSNYSDKDLKITYDRNEAGEPTGEFSLYCEGKLYSKGGFKVVGKKLVPIGNLKVFHKSGEEYMSAKFDDGGNVVHGRLAKFLRKIHAKKLIKRISNIVIRVVAKTVGDLISEMI